jgi:hypothetical protein
VIKNETQNTKGIGSSNQQNGDVILAIAIFYCLQISLAWERENIRLNVGTKKSVRYVAVKRSEVVKFYNTCMGEVNLFDQVRDLYRIFIRS